MLYPFESYTKIAREVADAMNAGDTVKADRLEQEYKSMLCKEYGWHPSCEKRHGDVMTAQLEYEAAYSNRRK